MKGPLRLPARHTPTGREFRTSAEEDEEDRFIGRPCYAFNHALKSNLDDTRCSHCVHYLTARCPHIDEFLDDVEDLSPD